MSELWNFILQVPANVLDTQDRENQMQKKKIYTKTYCDASKKAIEAFQTILLQVNFFSPMCFRIGGRILFVGIGMIALCEMWNCTTLIQKRKCTSKPYSNLENLLAFNDTVHQGQEKVPSAVERFST